MASRAERLLAELVDGKSPQLTMRLDEDALLLPPARRRRNEPCRWLLVCSGLSNAGACVVIEAPEWCGLLQAAAEVCCGTPNLGGIPPSQAVLKAICIAGQGVLVIIR